MNVIIPVAGEGIRLKPHTHFLPKCLLYVAGKTILEYIFYSIEPLNVSKVILVLGLNAEKIIQFCKKFSFNFKFIVQNQRLGLGHAIYLGSKGLQGPTLVLLGDTITDCNIKDFSGNINKLGVKKVDDPQRFGIVETDGKNVLSVVEKPEKPKSNLAIVGIYYFNDVQKINRAMTSVIKKGIKTKNEFQLTDGLAMLLKAGERFQIVKIKNWFDCGTPDALIDTNRHLLKKNNRVLRCAKSRIIPPVFIPDSAEIINSIVGPYVSVGECVRIHNSIIQDSIINSKAVIENAMFARSIIGQNAIVRGSFKKLNVGDFSMIEFP